jgi:hypothetical protein
VIGGSVTATPRISSNGTFYIHAHRHVVNNFGVIKLRYIGATLLITHLLDALNEVIPTASITVVVSRETEPVLVNNPAVDDIITVDRTALYVKYTRVCY